MAKYTCRIEADTTVNKGTLRHYALWKDPFRQRIWIPAQDISKIVHIFNSKLVLASPETASVADYVAIIGVIGHEEWNIKKYPSDSVEILLVIKMFASKLSSAPRRFGIPGETYYWTGGDHEMFVFIQTLNDANIVLWDLWQEADGILKLIKLAWSTLGIIQKLHQLLYGWMTIASMTGKLSHADCGLVLQLEDTNGCRTFAISTLCYFSELGNLFVESNQSISVVQKNHLFPAATALTRHKETLIPIIEKSFDCAFLVEEVLKKLNNFSISKLWVMLDNLQTITVETAAAVQMMIDGVKRTAQQHVNRVLKDQTRKIGALYTVDRDYCWSQNPVDMPLLLGSQMVLVFYLCDKCGIVLKLQQILSQNPFRSAKLAVRLPSLGFHFSPACYHRLMRIAKSVGKANISGSGRHGCGRCFSALVLQCDFDDLRKTWQRRIQGAIYNASREIGWGGFYTQHSGNIPVNSTRINRCKLGTNRNAALTVEHALKNAMECSRSCNATAVAGKCWPSDSRCKGWTKAKAVVSTPTSTMRSELL
ncbi:hypothetical protein NE237_030898 [Protea cynaroides]|uniref:Uncharacterized protein n=1 Tax=Protea cynaroides TaxID=273540 RepID=A0A9Q0GTV4_9MAGN|nr:hypothetical protein NE237_030898 [Protea cynaroides]